LNGFNFTDQLHLLKTLYGKVTGTQKRQLRPRPEKLR
jgi:hypothetical protein